MKALPVSTYIGALTIAALFIVPFGASAASLYMETAPNPVSVGDTIVLKAYLDTDAAPANALDGTISLGGVSTFSVKTISLAGSTLSLWPNSPAISADGKSINFTGGLPGGFTGTHLLLFTMVLNAQTAGQESFTPTNTHLYLNDGKGTATSVTGRALSIGVQPAQAGTMPYNEWQSTVSSDTTPPEPFTIYAGQDSTVYNGKKYIFFQTTDTQSGIDHYMVQEGNSAPVASGMTYVLKNQTTPETIIVSAYDKAGNVRTSVYTSPATTGPATIPVLVPILVLAFVLVFAIAYGAWRYTKRKQKA